MRTFWTILATFTICLSPLQAKKYKAKTIQVKPASQYAAHQDFQNVAIGAWAANTMEKVLEIFETEKVHKRKLMPLLVVVENNNDFAIRLVGRSIFLVLADGTNVPPIPFHEAFLYVTLKKPPSSYSTDPKLLIGKQRKKNTALFEDFEHKNFGEKLIAPHDSDYGVLFFWLPEEGGLDEIRLYIPEMQNMSTGDELMFFEFPLVSPR